MKKTFLHVISCFFILVSLEAPFIIQAQQTDTTAAVIQPIPLPEITVEATRVSSLLLEKQNTLLEKNQKSVIENRVDTLLLRLNLLREDARIHKLDELSFRNFDNLENRWVFLHSRLLNEQNILTDMVQEFENEKTDLEKLYTVWDKTLSIARESASPETVIEQVSITIKSIEDFLILIRSDSEFLQEKLVQISEGIIFCNTVLENIKSSQEVATKNLLVLKRPPIWKEFRQKKETIILSEQRSLIEDTVSDLLEFYSNYAFRIWLHLVLFLILIGITLVSFRNLFHIISEIEIPQISAIKKILKRPVSSGFLINFPLAFILYDAIPDSIRLMNTLLLLVPVVLILNDIITGPVKRFIYFLLVAVLLIQIHGLSYSDTLISRLFLLIIILFGLLTLALILGRKSGHQVILSSRLGKIMYGLIWLTAILLFVSLISVIFGAVYLAEFLTYATIKSAAIALVFYAFALTINSLIISSLLSKSLQKLNLIRQYYEKIYRTLINIINITSWILWLIFTLRFFSLWDDIYKAGKTILTASLSIGTVSIALGDVLVFVFIIWLTLWISRMIRIVVEGEVAPRVKARRGVPAAVSLIFRITIITIGFLLAIGAAGVEMSKLAILLGALGVGIGFGLQNIFNNLISGIIIAFERPINEGDIIEIGGNWGTVQQIGIRATTIRTFEGSEVVIPNGNLISNELTNWTLTDQQRRAELLVGVKYGTDPEKVLQILRQCADTHSEVLKEPKPLALFTSFGESSLDFRLLFWIPNADDRLRIQSDMAVIVNRALAEAGIEIPFPQRDVHFKTIDQSVTSQLMKGEKSGEQK